MSHHAEARTTLQEAFRLSGINWSRAEIAAIRKLCQQRELHAARQYRDPNTPQKERADFQGKEIFWRRQRLTLETLFLLLND